jgi:transcriptional regulator with XRE-family HTH domain
MENCKMICDQHRRLRKALGLTQAQLAESMGVHPNTIIDYEAGRLADLEDNVDAALKARETNGAGLPKGIEIVPAGHRDG